FLSTFRAARPDFGESGRQKSDIYPSFCLLFPLRSKEAVSSCTGFSLIKALHGPLAANDVYFHSERVLPQIQPCI
ncbi:hypothetical protein, partial [Ligilactobacillus ruminis]|uniref:hypothetical protein n=1 Tax=Ligilactobacillus ruminis TaxID=1623 RepID=UPI0019D36364